jgi:hypothetical protein
MEILHNQALLLIMEVAEDQAEAEEEHQAMQKVE